MNEPIGSGWPIRRERLVSATAMLARQRAGQAEAGMKSGARWTDRTGHAREGLHAGVELGLSASGMSFMNFAVAGGGSSRLRRIILFLAGGVEYQPWLETHKGPAYGHRASMSPEALVQPEVAGPLAVIHPTAKRLAPGYRAAVKRIWSRSR